MRSGRSCSHRGPQRGCRSLVGGHCLTRRCELSRLHTILEERGEREERREGEERG